MNPRKPRATAPQVKAAEALARTLGRSLSEVLESLGLHNAPPRNRARDRRKLKEEGGATCKACPSWRPTPATNIAFAYHAALPMCKACYKDARASQKERSLSAPPAFDILPGYRHRWLHVAVTVIPNPQQTNATECPIQHTIFLSGPQARARAAAILRTARQVAATRWDSATTTPSGKQSRRPRPSIKVTAELRAYQHDIEPLGFTREDYFFPWQIVKRNNNCRPESLLRNGATQAPYFNYTLGALTQLSGETFRPWQEAVRSRPTCTFCGNNFLWPDPDAESRWIREGRPSRSCSACYANRWIAALDEPAPAPAAPAPAAPAPAAPALRLEVW